VSEVSSQSSAGPGDRPSPVAAASVRRPERLPERRLVLLGASNLSRGLPTLLATVRSAWATPLDIVAAPGRGRSYGQTTRVLGRELSGIVSSELWSAWLERSPLPTFALLTDVGNDIMYGVPIERTLGWIEESLRRLRDGGAATVVTALPVHRISQMTLRQYHTLRAVLFPRNRDTLDMVLRRVADLDAGLRSLATSYGAHLLAPPPDWYGVDPIHIRRSQWSTAWGEIVAAWNPPSRPARVGIAPWTWLRAQLWQPAERRFFGVLQRRAQPSVSFADGTRLSLY